MQLYSQLDPNIWIGGRIAPNVTSIDYSALTFIIPLYYSAHCYLYTVDGALSVIYCIRYDITMLKIRN